MLLSGLIRAAGLSIAIAHFFRLEYPIYAVIGKASDQFTARSAVVKAARSLRAVSSGIRLAKSGSTAITRARSLGKKWLAQTSLVSRIAAATRRALAGLLCCTELMKPRIITGL